MKKETETEETIGYAIFLFLSLVAFQLGGGSLASSLATRMGDGNESATCIHCSKKISCIGSSIRGLFRHLKASTFLAWKAKKINLVFPRKQKLSRNQLGRFWLVKKKLAKYCLLTYSDRWFSIHAIDKSKFIRESISSELDAFVVCTFVVYHIVV